MPDLFTPLRPLLFSLAYRMLGTVSDAEDMVQEAYLRWMQVDLATIQSPKPYLCSVVTRLCIDQLRSAKTQRETYIGEWLPEPMLTDTMTHHNPAAHTELAESLSMAFLQLMERLSPTERAAYLLHEVFDYGYDEIADFLDTSAANCRQLVKRGKDHLSQTKARFQFGDDTERKAIVTKLLQACTVGDIQQVQQLLATDIVSYADGGGLRGAGLRPVVGAPNVARLLVGLRNRAPAGYDIQLGQVNGEIALIGTVKQRTELFNLLIISIVDQQVQNLYSIVNPDKLRPIAQQLGLAVATTNA
jgi:RNA polymerase sigma-70 factor, ECF subfamily